MMQHELLRCLMSLLCEPCHLHQQQQSTEYTANSDLGRCNSPAQWTLLVRLLQSSIDFVVVGTASKSINAIAAARRLRPDIIAMNVVLPLVGSLEATRQITQPYPTRTALVSSAISGSALQQQYTADLKNVAAALLVDRQRVQQW